MRRPLPDLPGVSAFPELNLRLYVVAGGKPGVWFISLDAAHRLAVWAARRFFHLPYFHADMDVRDDGTRIHYRSVRRARQRVAFRGSYGPESAPFEARPGTLEHFLTERYCLYTTSPSGDLLRAEVQHRPWPLQRASADIEENSILSGQGLGATGQGLGASGQGLGLEGPPALLHFSRRLDVVVWPIETIGPSARPALARAPD